MMNYQQTMRHRDENKKNPDTRVDRGYVTGRWNDELNRVEYLGNDNSGYCWVGDLKAHLTIKFELNPRSKYLSNLNGKRGCPIFDCKVFRVTRSAPPYGGSQRRVNGYKLTNHNHWHKLQGLMNI